MWLSHCPHPTFQNENKAFCLIKYALKRKKLPPQIWAIKNPLAFERRLENATDTSNLVPNIFPYSSLDRAYGLGSGIWTASGRFLTPYFFRLTVLQSCPADTVCARLYMLRWAGLLFCEVYFWMDILTLAYHMVPFYVLLLSFELFLAYPLSFLPYNQQLPLVVLFTAILSIYEWNGNIPTALVFLSQFYVAHVFNLLTLMCAIARLSAQPFCFL